MRLEIPKKAEGEKETQSSASTANSEGKTVCELSSEVCVRVVHVVHVVHVVTM